jgi:LacI family transcriptional regulator
MWHFMQATIRDVAKKAGVGLGTVSRVINGSPQVREQTRVRVLQAIEELDFQPSRIARRLSLGKTLTIAVVVPFFTRHTVTERMRGIEATLSGSEYDMVFYNIETPERMQAAFRELAQRKRVDGALVISLDLTEEESQRFQQSNMPLVLIDAHFSQVEGVSCIDTDDVRGGKLVVEHLLSLGHRRIGCIGDGANAPFQSMAGRLRFDGCHQALKAAGIELAPALFHETNGGRHEARLEALRLIESQDPPTAIFASNDSFAIGVLEAAREAGMSIPYDLSVVGYNDEEFAEYLDLTTIRPKYFESGQRGMEVLLDRLANNDREPAYETLEPELIVRGSTLEPRPAA